MKPITDRKIIDLHCDTLTECYKRRVGLRNSELHFSLDKLPEGYRLCQAMAVFMPDEYRGVDAEQYFDSVAAVLARELQKHGDEVCLVGNTAHIGHELDCRRFALMLTVEGGSALAGKLESLYKLHKLGVKMITLTWNAANEICGGAATDLGFTNFGRQVVAEMERLGIAVDVSHLSDRGFWELCDLTAKPFLASHSNARAICPHRRNLTDDMFRIIVKRGGVVGLNYYKAFIIDGGNTTSVEDLLRHLHHFLALGGEDIVALGSDFDGADLPDYINGLDKIGFLCEAMEKSGIPAKVVDKILFENAQRYFVNLGGNEHELCEHA